MTLRQSLTFIICLLTSISFAQTHTVKGIIIDKNSEIPIPYANVVLLNTNPILGTVTDEEGNYSIEGVPIGKYDIQASFVGYRSAIKKDIEVTAAKVVQVEIALEENISTLSEVIVKPDIDKEQALNPMSLVGARMLSIEEANRYAGGFDDPARLAASFAGVSSGVNNNGIVVRGNAPKSLQWKLEGIEIPNPNHFANLASFGGGALTAMSSQLLANSDFLTGAFSAEYSNALSGVFDIKMRSGNKDDREHTFQLGALGIDVASEGPFKKGKNASYLFNYRYSTFGLVGQITGAEEGIKYQDLSFKLNFPTKKWGTFSLWGLGLLDKILIAQEPDTSKWVYERDEERYVADQYMAAFGLNHKLILSNRSYLHTTLGYTISNTDWKVDAFDEMLHLQPKSTVLTRSATYVLKSTLNTKFNKRHTNRTGIVATQLDYKSRLANRTTNQPDLETLVDENNSSYLLTAFSSSNFRLNNALTLNVGLNGQLFTLNNNYTIEPRVALKWEINAKQNLGVAYGLHSRLEQLNYYFTKDNTSNTFNNKDMDFSKSHHFGLSYANKISDNWLFKIEPYFQFQFNVPVIEGNYYSFLNQQDTEEWFLSAPFQNIGKGRNYGVDFTLEKYLSKGLYGLVTASLFSSKYLGGDNVWRDTRYNKHFIFNFLIGKEWYFGENKRKTFGLNARATAQGGNRYTPYFEQESIESKTVIFDYNNAFSDKFQPELIIHFSVNYKINKEKTTQEFALRVLNAGGYGDFLNFGYNRQTQEIDAVKEVIVIPNLSYKISF